MLRTRLSYIYSLYVLIGNIALKCLRKVSFRSSQVLVQVDQFDACDSLSMERGSVLLVWSSCRRIRIRVV